MKLRNRLWLRFLPLYVLSGCGSAEAIKMYVYETKKVNLEKAVMKVINNNPNIHIDNTDTVEKKADSALFAKSRWTSADSASYYDSVHGWLGLTIKAGESDIYYLCRYRGERPYWETSPVSAIFISTAHDKNGNAVYQGQNEHGEFSSKFANDLIDLFEKELVNKLDKELHLEHTNSIFD